MNIKGHHRKQPTIKGRHRKSMKLTLQKNKEHHRHAQNIMGAQSKGPNLLPSLPEIKKKTPLTPGGTKKQQIPPSLPRSRRGPGPPCWG